MKVGDIYWEAEVRGSGEASEAAAQLEESHSGVVESAEGASSAQDSLSASTQENTEATEKNERWTRRAKVATGLLGSALFFVAKQFGVASTATTVYAGAAGLATTATTALTGAVGTLYAALLGPAGIAVAVLAATAGVGLLSAELLGITDVTPVAEQSLTSMGGLFADLGFLIAGPITGLIGASLLALTGDFEGAKNLFVSTSVEWAKAAARLSARVQLGFRALGIAVETGVASAVETADYLWVEGMNSLITTTNEGVQSISDGLSSGLEQAANNAITEINSLIAAANRVPGVDIDTVGAVDIDPPQVQVASTLEQESLDSRLGGVRREGRADLRAAREATRRRIEAFQPRALSRRRDATGGTTPTRSGREEVTQEITVEIGDQSLDLSNLSRRDRRQLASEIGDELGGDTGNITGAR